MSNNTLTVSQFQQLLGNTIRMNPDLRNVWVQAELSDVRVSGGHCYMELVEKDTVGTTRAKIKGNIWASCLFMLRRKFFEATGRDIANGMKVLVHGSASHHQIYGLSFNITDIDPTYTLGDIERVRREILERLTREGVINNNKGKCIPLAPQRIAVISAAGAAGYGDFMNQIENNQEGFAVYAMLFPAVMQGEKTPESVMHALDLVEMTAAHWDAVVIIRGGGATTDMTGFDNYELARRVATFPLPVIVGIGHERDRTVLDEIACVRCKTPTAVAAFIIDALRTSYAEATERVRRIAAFGADALRGEHMRLNNLGQSIPAYSRNVLLQSKLRLNNLAQRIPAIVGSRVMRQRLALSEYANRLKAGVDNAIGERKNVLQRMAMRIENATEALHQRETLRLERLSAMLRLLSPENTLKRGYSITRVNGKAMRDIAEVPEDAIIETTLLNGKITSKRIE